MKRSNFLTAWAALILFIGAAAGHDIPNDVTVLGFLKPEGNKLSILIRVPLQSIHDVNFAETPSGMIDVAKSLPLVRQAAQAWIVDSLQLYENDVALPRPTIDRVHLAMESDKSFADYAQALAQVSVPQQELNVVWTQALLDVQLEVPIHSELSRFSVHSILSKLGVQTVTVFRFILPNGALRVFEFRDDPGILELDPSWLQAAGRFVGEGFLHILDGIDHLLFLLCLVIPFRKFKMLVPVVTAFTLAHSVTLIASAYDLAPGALWFPPLIETLIAASIVYMALENIVGAGTINRRWMMAFGFGLVHGFGFSFALRETLQFAGSHLLTSLLSFNLGVELGQLLVLAILIPALEILFRFVVAERMGTIILSALVAHTGWHWMIERGSQLSQYRYQWPSMDAAFLAASLRWGVLALLAGGLVWGVSLWVRRSQEG